MQMSPNRLVWVTTALLSLSALPSLAQAPATTPAASALSADPPTLVKEPRPLEERRTLKTPGEDPLSADELERRAIELGERSNRGRAIEFLERALKLEPKRGRLYRLLGVLYRDTGRIAKAERSFRKATRLSPKDPLAWADLAAVLERSGSHKEAIKAANRAVALSKDDAGMRADRAIIRYRLGQLDAAIDDGVAALKGLDYAPRFEADVAMMRLTRGRKDDITAALSLLTRARAMLKSDASIALAHAQALLAAGRSEPAEQAYDGLLKRNRNQAWANWGRGLLAWRVSDWALAKEHGRQARKVLPHVFSEKGHNRRQFFSKDAIAYLRWLDDQLAADQANKRSPGGPAVMESLKVRGACERGEIQEALDKRLPALRACYAEHVGRIEIRFSTKEGAAQAVTRSGKGISRDVDTCVLRLLRASSFPDKTTCRVEVAWNRPVQMKGTTFIPQATRIMPAPKVIAPHIRDSILAPAPAPKPSPSTPSDEQNKQRR